MLQDRGPFTAYVNLQDIVHFTGNLQHSVSKLATPFGDLHNMEIAQIFQCYLIYIRVIVNNYTNNNICSDNETA